MTSAGIANWFRKILGTVICSGDDPPATGAVTDVSVGHRTLIDVRTKGEFHSGHIQGAICVPLDRLQIDIVAAVPDRKTPLLMYCRSGARARIACAVAAQMGYENVVNGGAVGKIASTMNRPITKLAR